MVLSATYNDPAMNVDKTTLKQQHEYKDHGDACQEEEDGKGAIQQQAGVRASSQERNHANYVLANERFRCSS